MTKKIGIIGDLHLKEKLGYSDYVKGNRKEEEKEIFDSIVETLGDCDEIVFLGDNFNSKNNTSEVIKKLVVFLERFSDKKLYILAGNHEKHADGRSAIDFLKEIDKPNWKVITNEIFVTEDKEMVFLPYMTKPELEVEDNDSGTKRIMKTLKKGKFFFAHHAISDSMVNGISTSIFDEVILPKDKLEKLYDIIFAGHVHTPQELKGGKIFISGSIFNNEVGEKGKYVWKVDKETLEVASYKLPGRGIYKLENPTIEKINKIDKSNILKVVINDKKLKKEISKIKNELKKFDASILLEQYSNERKKVHFEEGMLDLKVDKLLDIYAKEKKVDIKKLNLAWNLIK